MVVLKPLLEGERSKTCPKCSHIGIISPVSERSSFYPRNSDDRTKWNAHCRACNGRVRRKREMENREECARKKRERYHKRRKTMTPEQLEEQRREWRERRRESSNKPGVKARRAVANRKYEDKLREERGKEMREDRRIDAMLRNERRGKPLPSLEQVRTQSSRSYEALPIEPFRQWIKSLLDEIIVVEGPNADAQQRVGALLRTHSRRIYAWLTEYKSIDYCAVDRAASRHGGTTVEQIYRNYLNGEIKSRSGKGVFAFVVYHCEPPTTAVATGERRLGEEVLAHKVKTCRSPGCDDAPVEESRFCGFHKEVLARIKSELSGEAKDFRKTIKKKGQRSTCCRPGCNEPRISTDRYCDQCYADGWREEDIE